MGLNCQGILAKTCGFAFAIALILFHSSFLLPVAVLLIFIAMVAFIFDFGPYDSIHYDSCLMNCFLNRLCRKMWVVMGGIGAGLLALSLLLVARARQGAGASY